MKNGLRKLRRLVSSLVCAAVPVALLAGTFVMIDLPLTGVTEAQSQQPRRSAPRTTADPNNTVEWIEAPGAEFCSEICAQAGGNWRSDLQVTRPFRCGCLFARNPGAAAPVSPIQPAAPELPPVPAAPAAPPQTAGGGVLDQLVAEINNARAQGAVCTGKNAGTYPPAGPVQFNAAMSQVTQNYLDIQGQQGGVGHGDLRGRVEQTCQPGTYGENIAYGGATPADAVRQWLESQHGHCATLMRSDYNLVGTAASQHNSEYQQSWAALFADRC